MKYIYLLLLLVPITTNAQIFTELTNSSFEKADQSFAKIVDIDNDGDSDIVLSAYNYINDPFEFTKIYLNNGLGIFTESMNQPFSDILGHFSLFDIDNDGDLDMIHIATIYINDGSGNFTESTQTIFSDYTDWTVSSNFGDFDNDGDLDLIIAGYDGDFDSRIIKLYLNDGAGSFTEVSGMPFVAVSAASIVVVDYNNDSLLDIVISGSDGANNTLRFYKNNGNLSFTRFNFNASDTNLTGGALVFADIDNDNDYDFIITGENSVGGHSKLYKNTGTWFSHWRNFIGLENSSVAFDDVDSDGYLDLLLSGDIGSGVSPRTNLYINNNGHFSSGSSVSHPFENISDGSLNFLDIENDGDMDLFITGRTSGYTGYEISKLYRNNLNQNEIRGTIKYDSDNDGCGFNDLIIPNILISTNNGTEAFGLFSDSNGFYDFFTSSGVFTTVIETSFPDYYTITPNTHTSSFNTINDTYTADFCITSNQNANDVSISLIPTIPARPGFNAGYKIIYKNAGTTQLNGSITLEFDEAKSSFLNASETINTETSNSLTFNYINLAPFETRAIDLEFNVFAPPTVSIDDILTFTTTINPITSDYTIDDNIFELNQTVIGSYDPNDITCLEGNQVLYTDKDKYLHYIVRFQNTGTASAINIVVKNILDNHLDWSTLQLESLSHNNIVAIKNSNEIEFIFENINLPDSTTDEPNSHGFIAYKIKPKADIALGDIIQNKADIFFDFNEAIETNTATTTIVNALAVNENTLLDFSVYPTPTESILNVKLKTKIVKIEIYSKLGQLILKNETKNNIDISNLTNGLYFVKVEDINGNFGVKKIMKK